MRKDLEKLFGILKAPEPQPHLFNKVMKRIAREERLSAVRHAFGNLVFFAVSFVGSVSVLLPTFRMLRADVAQSGFFEFFSLMFSDLGSVADYWQSFGLALLESLPAASIALFLASVFVLLGSFKFLARGINYFSRRPLFINH